MKHTSSEHEEQVTFFQYVRVMARQDSRYKMIFAIPNGGHRHKTVAGKLKAEGVEPGVPDIFCAVPMGFYHGLFIEMKVGKNKPTAKQQDWLERLAIRGYLVTVCYGASEAIQQVTRYFKGG